MTKHRGHLPQLDGGLYLTDGGIETCLIFLEGLDLPHFAAFHLLQEQAGREALRRYFERYMRIAADDGHGFILESPTWRASSDWGEKLGYSRAALAAVNRDAILLMHELRDVSEGHGMPVVVSGCVGPRGDGYDPGQVMTAKESESYHAAQIEVFAGAGADMITAITMTNVNEAVGVARAAGQAGMPVAISFTVETDGRLPTGDSLESAISAVDAATGGAPAYYMINCAHPTHFADRLESGGVSWMSRVRGVRANASRRSHAELNEAPDLDAGDPVELGGQYRELLRRHPQINVLGGCCGTDHRHVACISEACKTLASSA
ncbi:MAG TPA: homocysteine S-methyltransferase family protein [Hyphomicrobiaceae bacterium]|nr:homocysteine S-methyltransferase family protein [Hyphomicrobiaceae bacterium]